MTNASNFIQHRKNIFSVTDKRIKTILWYIIECNNLFLKNTINPYSKKWVATNTTISFEDYLKFELIDNYLVKNKHLLNGRLSVLENINFSAETQKRYIDSDGKQKPDKIDIYINKIGLQKEWNENDENIYFAVECKRIKILSDTKNYILDISKFCSRNHSNLRLPFEGQIGFIENSKLNHLHISGEINNELKKGSTINTTSPLKSIDLHSNFDGGYSSSHKKSFDNYDIFSIYHLLFDYSAVVTE
ncbi:hypothetical protein [Pedobacter frigiditerrae]|uniref:hypothetical protein n=1 Tax=Pedobacter frigiditerrae TaxID=2530452 RepID=UPI00292D5FC3|nr:hypothetical protein [Pedobacter frigiditerrae]